MHLLWETGQRKSVLLPRVLNASRISEILKGGKSFPPFPIKNMPAVQLTQLKAQINDLLWKYTRPEEFLEDMHQLFEQHSFRVLRTGRGIQSADLIPTYHIPQMVQYQLEIALGQQCAENPKAALPLADTLWKDPYLEMRQIAAFLLGQVPLNPPEAVLDRLTDWCQPNENKAVLKAVLEKGSTRICRDMPDQWLGLAAQWISTSEIPWQSMGLKGLLPLIDNREFENLPPIYRVISPLIQTAKPELQSDLLAVINALANRSPTETFFLLRQLLSIGTTSNAHRMIRRTLPSFPAVDAARLREILKKFSENASG